MVMNLQLNPQTQRLIDDRLNSGRYATAEDVVTAALHALELDERSEDFEAGELERLLEEGEKSGAPLNGEEVLTELRRLGSRAQSEAG
jgi:putative addiction module CopG family antidote